MRNEVAALLAAVTLLGCAAPSRSAPARWPTAPAGAWASGPQPPAWTTGPVAETRDPWWAGPASAPPPSPRAELGTFLVVLDLRGPGGAARLPDAHATLARLGGVQRTAPLWEIAPQPGGGLGSVAATLERELCAEDLVVVYRARNGGMERSEFAGHRACRGDASSPVGSPPAAAPSPSPPATASPPSPPARRDPFYDRF